MQEPKQSFRTEVQRGGSSAERFVCPLVASRLGLKQKVCSVLVGKQGMHGLKSMKTDDFGELGMKQSPLS